MKRIIAAIAMLTLVGTLFTGCIFTCDVCGDLTIGNKNEALGHAICDDCLGI